MTRNAAVLGLVLLALAGVLPQAAALSTAGSIDVSTDGPIVADADDVPAQAVRAVRTDLDAPSLLASRAGVGGAPEAADERAWATPAGAPQAVAASDVPGRLPPAVAVAGTATGLALILGLLASQGGALAAGLFSRLQGQDVLHNDVRHRIHEAIGHNPGITIKELTTLCGVGWGTAVYHLRRLEAERLVVSERVRQFRRFYRNGGGIVNEAKAAFGELKSDTGQRLAREIANEPGTCQKDLCTRVGVSAPVAHKYIRRLRDAGLVEEQREWKSVRYFPTPQLTELLAVAGAALAAPASPVAHAVAA